MRYRSAVVAGLAALGLVAATSPSTAPVGTATTEIAGAEIRLSGPVDVPAISVLDLTSFASTDADTDRNPAGGPFAALAAIPAAIGQQIFGESSVTSDDGGSLATAAVDESVGPVNVVVNALNASATAGAGRAEALLNGATARVSALEGLSALSLEDAGSAATVTTQGARGFQGVTLAGLGLDLGDLLPVEQLPLDVVLDLARQLQNHQLLGQLTGALGDLVNEVLALADTLERALGELDSTVTDYNAAATELESLLGQLADAQQRLDELTDELADANALLDAGDATQDAVDDLVGQVGDTVEDTVGDLGDTVDDVTGGILSTQQADDVNDQLADLIADVEASIDDTEAIIAGLTSDIADLTETVENLLATISGLVDDVTGALDDLVAGLQELLGQLPDVLDAIAATDLAQVGNITAGLTAVAGTDSADASLECAVSNVRLVGVDLTPPDCFTPVNEANVVVRGALSRLDGVLGALPVVEDVVPDARFKLFPDVREETGTDGPYRTALTHVTLLELEIPSVELGAVTDGLLEGLTSADLSSLLDGLEDTLQSDLGGVLGTVGGLTDALDATIADVTGAVSSIVDVESVLDGLLSQLPASDALAGLSTLGVRVVVDPTVTAQFAPGGAAGAPLPPEGGDSPTSGAPDGEDDDTGTAPLPVTGGGLAILAILSSGGALLLARRRSFGE